jgi:excisionase family DNA binding protein
MSTFTYNEILQGNFIEEEGIVEFISEEDEAEEQKLEAQATEKEKWFNTDEAAQYLEVSKQTIFRWIRDRSITFFKVGNSTRFKKKDLNAMITRHVDKRLASREPLECENCGSENLSKGRIRGAGHIHFYPEKVKFFTLKTSHIEIHSYVCTDCGKIMQRADVEKLSELLEGKETEDENK